MHIYVYIYICIYIYPPAPLGAIRLRGEGAVNSSMSREVLDVCFKSQMLSEMSPNCLLVGPETMNLPPPDLIASAMGPPQNPLKNQPPARMPQCRPGAPPCLPKQ